MLEHSPGHEPVAVVGIGLLGRGLVRKGEDVRAAVWIAIELETLARLHIWVAAFAITPTRFLAVDDWPAQSGDLVIPIERRQVVPMAAPEAGVFLEQPFLDIEAESS